MQYFEREATATRCHTAKQSIVRHQNIRHRINSFIKTVIPLECNLSFLSSFQKHQLCWTFYLMLRNPRQAKATETTFLVCSVTFVGLWCVTHWFLVKKQSHSHRWVLLNPHKQHWVKILQIWQGRQCSVMSVGFAKKQFCYHHAHRSTCGPLYLKKQNWVKIIWISLVFWNKEMGTPLHATSGSWLIQKSNTQKYFQIYKVNFKLSWQITLQR